MMKKTHYLLILLSMNIHWLKSNANETSSTTSNEIEFSINRYQKDFDIGFKQGIIKIQNHYGDVHLKNTKAHQIGVSIIAQELGQNPAIHELTIEKAKGQIYFSIDYNKADIAKHNNKSVEWPIGRVDLVVFVPEDMQIDIETVDGSIDVRKTKNWIKAKSQTGKIDIANHYDIEASSVSGRIKVFPMGTNWKNGIKLTTKSAPIYAVIPVNKKVNLNINTSNTLFSRMDSPESWVKIDSKKYNSTATNYQIKSDSGDVYISPHELLMEK